VDASLYQSILDTARVVSIPLRTKFRGVTEREALIFEGPNGFTEWAPFTEYEDEEAASWLASAIEFGWGSLPALNRNEIGINATLPAVAPDQIEKALKPFGVFRTVKIKVAQSGETLTQDLERVLHVKTLYPQARLRLDANGGYSVEQALDLAGSANRE